MFVCASWEGRVFVLVVFGEVCVFELRVCVCESCTGKGVRLCA